MLGLVACLVWVALAVLGLLLVAEVLPAKLAPAWGLLVAATLLAQRSLLARQGFP